MWDVSGVTGAAPVWQDVMRYLHAGASTAQPVPARPAGVVGQAIRYQSNIEAPREEYFLTGTAQSVIVSAVPEQIRPAISHPPPGMLVALDPDIPPARQRIRFEAQGAAHGTWRLDGKPLGARAGSPASSGRILYDWMPWPGQHTLALLDTKGKVLDEVRFEVRGATVKGRR
jgi:penicillin-binding protein 1C